MAAMDHGKLLRLGIIGSIMTALCCATPLLVVIFGVVGLTAYVGILDAVLLPLLAIFLGITGFALYQRQRQARTK